MHDSPAQYTQTRNTRKPTHSKTSTNQNYAITRKHNLRYDYKSCLNLLCFYFSCTSTTNSPPMRSNAGKTSFSNPLLLLQIILPVTSFKFASCSP